MSVLHQTRVVLLHRERREKETGSREGERTHPLHRKWTGAPQSPRSVPPWPLEDPPWFIDGARWQQCRLSVRVCVVLYGICEVCVCLEGGGE